MGYPRFGEGALRSATWKVLRASTLRRGFREVYCRGLNGLVRDKEARFVLDLEKGARVLDPRSGQARPGYLPRSDRHEDAPRGRVPSDTDDDAPPPDARPPISTI
jgi:hypothetical protein